VVANPKIEHITMDYQVAERLKHDHVLAELDSQIKDTERIVQELELAYTEADTEIEMW
jgi:hypothetical protein